MRARHLAVILAVVFGLVGLALVVLGILGPPRVFVGVGGIFVAVAVFAVVMAISAARDDARGDEPFEPVTPRGITSGQPWSFIDVASELAFVLQETPYRVEANPERIRVRADLADARFLTVNAARRVQATYSQVIVRQREGVATTEDAFMDVDWTGSAAGPRFSGRMRYATGKSWRRTTRVEYGVGADGTVGRQVDFTFSTDEIQRPVSAVLQRAGWRERWPTSVRGAVVMAGIGASAIVIVPVAFLIRWLVG